MAFFHFSPCALGLGCLLATALSAQIPAGSTTFALTGDSIINRRISTYHAPGFDDLIARIRKADVAFTNFETLIHEFDIPGNAQSGGTYMGSASWTPDELKWAGFDLFSVANNHTFDFGLQGMRSTSRALKAAGVVFAGTGENLALARSASFLDTPRGRVALIACTSTFTPDSIAGAQRPDLPGRPGVNPVRFTTTYTVDATTLEALKALNKKTRTGISMMGTESTAFKFLGVNFIEGSESRLNTQINPTDLKEIAAVVRNARQVADWVIVSIHAHEGASGNREVPADFLVNFSHAVIEAGADILVGHGPHLLRGIEVYRGKPIFYSLGDFIFENETVIFQPAENYDALGLPASSQPSDYFNGRSKNDTVSFPADQALWESVLAEVEFTSERELKAVRVYPVELGFKKSRQLRGRPVPASEAAGARIVGHLSDLGKPYGTSIDYNDGVGTLVWNNHP